MALMNVRTEGLVEILPVGTAVFDSEHPELTGKVAGYEYHESGVLSAIPYRIKWDDEDLAQELRGMMYWWSTTNGVVAGGKPA